VPAIGGAIHKGLQQEPYWKPFFDGFQKVHEWLAQVKPDVAIVFNNDHGLNFFLDKMPTFAVGAAAEYHNADEGWGLPIYKPFAGHAELSWHIINSLVEDEFELAWPDVPAWPVKIVPFAINTVQHPLPSAKRCLALGQAVNKALQSWTGDERIVIIGTGGLSHQLDGERAGYINPAYDTFCMDNLSVDPAALTRDSVHEMVRKAGTQGVEVLNWIAARGALGVEAAKEIHRNYHIPISNTAAATMLMEPA